MEPYVPSAVAAARIQAVYRGHLGRRYHFGLLNWSIFNVLDNDEENVRHAFATGPPAVHLLCDGVRSLVSLHMCTGGVACSCT